MTMNKHFQIITFAFWLGVLPFQDAFAGSAYQCTNLDGATYLRANPCPKGGWVITDPQTGAGFSGLVKQEVIDRKLACQKAKDKRDRSEPSRMPDEYIQRVNQNITELCN